MLLVMASSRAGLQRVSGHMACAGSDGPAKKIRNVETNVAMMTLKARANRLRMYVSTFCLPNEFGRRWWGPGENPGPPPRLSVQISHPRGSAVTADLLLQPDLRDLRHALVRVGDHVLDLRAEHEVA